jgi:hypothetical protein
MRVCFRFRVGDCARSAGGWKGLDGDGVGGGACVDLCMCGVRKGRVGSCVVVMGIEVEVGGGAGEVGRRTTSCACIFALYEDAAFH